MDEFYGMHGMHGPHGGWGWGPGVFGLLPLLLMLLWLVPLALLLWSTRHTLFGRLASAAPTPPAEAVSSVELLSQRYMRGEIDITTFENLLDELADGGEPPDPQFQPRADVPVDWS